ncbi:hydroxyacid dehydrogenase [Bacillus sp. FSL K6-3431]|uniref:hydroxyacid dehydrogenase n=1 Tax=Bacillus sp. FSL K6-3431 TaxID=2921500 RepID=UPI0030F78A45
MKLKTIVLPAKDRLDDVCSKECYRLLNKHFDPVWNDLGREYTEVELYEIINDAEVVLTSWGSPKITDEMLDIAPHLRVIAHAAGTVKGRVPQAVFERNIKVFSAAPRIAHSVGEYCLTALLTLIRQLPRFDAAIRQGEWKIGLRGRELTGATVGIVSASSTARAFIKLLAPFDVKILLFDPYLSDEASNRLGVEKASLEEVMQCHIISVHAPALPATENMLNRDLLRLIPNGAIFINSSRGTVLDEQALVENLKTGRFLAALDVFSKEPLSIDHPLRFLDNVLLSPHIAGDTKEGHLALMEEVVKDIITDFNGGSTKYVVNEEMWKVLA